MLFGVKNLPSSRSPRKKIQDVIDCNDYYPPRLVAVMSVAFARPDHLAE